MRTVISSLKLQYFSIVMGRSMSREAIYTSMKIGSGFREQSKQLRSLTRKGFVTFIFVAMRAVGRQSYAAIGDCQ